MREDAGSDVDGTYGRMVLVNGWMIISWQAMRQKEQEFRLTDGLTKFDCLIIQHFNEAPKLPPKFELPKKP